VEVALPMRRMVRSIASSSDERRREEEAQEQQRRIDLALVLRCCSLTHASLSTNE